jgi:glycosyltransferase involved in cell wall biosynthesis
MSRGIKGVKKKRLLIATDNFLPRWDGIARFLSLILPEIVDEFDVTVIAPKFNGKFSAIPGVKIIRLPIHSFRIGDYHPPKFNFSVIKENVKRADLVWIQAVGPIGSSAILWSKILKKPVVAYIHSLEHELISKSIDKGVFFRKLIFNFAKFYTRFCYNRCNLLMVPSLDTTEILSWQKIRTKKVVIHLGIDSHKFSLPFNRDNSKKSLGLLGKTVIGFSGRISREKDLLTLYRAFLRLKGVDNLKLLIVGGGVPSITDYLFSKKNVILTGPVDNILDYLHAMDIFVMPSLTETSSLATMEAMSTGLPVIATPVGHMKNYVEDGFNGFIFPRKDNYVLSKKLGFLISDPSLRKVLGINARDTILDSYRWVDSVVRIKKVLHILVDE